MDTLLPYSNLISEFIISMRTELVVVLTGLLVWLRIAVLARQLRAQQEQSLAKADLFVASEHSLHARLEAVLNEVRALNAK